MSQQAIILVLLSACLHATWNLFSKNSGSPVAFLLKALKYSLIAYIPLFLWMQFYVEYTPKLIICLFASGTCTGLYFYSLGKAYHHGEVSVAYPIARAFPILVVTFSSFFMTEFLSVQGLAGIFFVVAGCFILPWRRFVIGPEGLCLSNYFTWSVFWAIMAALFTAAFSIIDKYAAGFMPVGGEWQILNKINYVYLQNGISLLAVILLVRISGYKVYEVPKKRALVCGLIFLFSYSLIMMALSTDPVAYVVSFRQLSIVLASVISMLFLEKDFLWPRAVGVATVFFGIILVGLA